MAQPPPTSNPLLTLDGINKMAIYTKAQKVVLSSKTNKNEVIYNETQLEEKLSQYVPVINVDPLKLQVVPDPPLTTIEGEKCLYPPEPTTRLPFLNRVALIVGGSKNIGKNIATHLHSLGYIVIATSRYPQAYTASENPLLSPYKLDVRIQSSVDNFFNLAIKPLGRLDYLILCNGMHSEGNVTTSNSQDLKSYFELTPIGGQRCIQAALPYLRKNPNSRVISTSSVAGGQSLSFPYFGYKTIAVHALAMHMFQLNVDERLLYASGAIENPVTYVNVLFGVVLSTIGSYDNIVNTNYKNDPLVIPYHTVLSAEQTDNFPGIVPSSTQIVAKQIYDIISAPQPGFCYCGGSLTEQILSLPIPVLIQQTNKLPDHENINNIFPIFPFFINTGTANFARLNLINLYS